MFEKLELLGLESWTEENKERALNLLEEYHDILALEDGEMACTEAAEHKIKVWEHWDYSSVSTCPLGYAMFQQLSSD